VFTRSRQSHLLFECCAEGLQIRFEESDVSADHAEMGDLLSLYPKIHCLGADAQVHRGFADRERNFFGEEGNPTALPPGELRWGRCFGLMPICRAFSWFTPKVYRRRSKTGSAAVAQSE